MSKNAEVRIRAQAVSRGVAAGKAVCLYGKRRQYFRTQISDQQLPKELRRFRAAVRLAGSQLRRLDRGNSRGRLENAASILDYHQLMLSDPTFLGGVEKTISDERINAEWAIKLVTDGFLAQYR